MCVTLKTVDQFVNTVLRSTHMVISHP